MKYTALLFSPLFALAFGCNTAQISQPSNIDAGPPCEDLHPVISCDASAATPGACPGEVTVVLDYPDASNTIPPGSYPPGCTVSFFVQDRASALCNRAPACTCPEADPDAGEAGAPDAGVWSCSPTQ